MTAAFRDAEADYLSLVDSIKKDLATLTHSLTREARSGTAVFNRAELVMRLERQHNSMQTALAHMELESNEGAPDQVAACKERVAATKRDAFGLHKEIQRAKQEAPGADREDLLKRAGGPNGRGGAAAATGSDPEAAAAALAALPDGPGKTDAQLAQMARNTQTLSRATDHLTKALRYIVRTNELGDTILVDLKKQDEALDRIAGVTSESHGEMTVVQRTLRDMRWLGMKHSLILSATAFALLATIVALLYYRFGRPLSLLFAGNSTAAAVIRPPSSSPVVSSTMAVMDGFVLAPPTLVMQNMIPG